MGDSAEIQPKTPAKGGRPLEYTPEQVSSAIIAAGGILAAAAKALGCTPKTVRTYIGRYKACREALYEAKELRKDYVESKLFQRIDKEDTVAIIFYLKTQAQDRGYIEPRARLEMEAAAAKTADGNEGVIVRVVYEDSFSGSAEAS